MLKTKRSYSLFFAFMLLALIAATPVLGSEEGAKLQSNFDKANAYISSYRHFEAVETMLEAEEQADGKHPSLHMRLAILYYGLGLLPEAINQGEKAVYLAPSSKWYRFDLAKFYYVAKQSDNAEEQLKKLLELDPGFTLGYYYLAKLYSEKRDYNRAWLSLQRAKLLGFQGKQFLKKLSSLSSQPKEDLKNDKGQNHLFRFIKTDNEKMASEALEQLQSGQLFENIELERIAEKDNQTLFGLMMGNELPAEVEASLGNNQPYAPAVLVKIGADYQIMQHILPFNESSWDTPGQPKKNPPIIAQKTPNSQALQKNSPDNTKENLSDKLAAMYAVENWQMSWAEQNIAEYLRAYSGNFIPPSSLSLDDWKAKRQKSLSKPSYISIEIKDLVIEITSDKHMSATFIQSYESNIFSDVVRKKLTMEKESNSWKIIQETEIEKLSP